jgi:fumarate reductase flavoprotein subunit
MVPVSIPKKWDYEADIIIIGAGTAGLPAATVAAEAGAKVAVLELMSYCASSLALVNVGPAFAGTDVQKEQGVDDSPEQYYKDGVELAKGVPELWKVYTENQIDTYYWCKKIGVKFGELFAPPAHTRRRGFFVKGSDMLRVLEKTAKEKGVEILFLHRATRLIANPRTGRVLGIKVRVKDSKEEKNFKAKKAVIVASGGFGRNREMVEEYGPEFVNWVPTMPPGHLGDGLKMALAVGAGTKDLGHAVCGSFAVDVVSKTGVMDFVGYAGGIMVNVNGQRFWDEATRKSFYGMLSERGMQQPGGFFYVVFDDKAKNKVRPGKLGKAKPFQGNTIEEMAEKAGIDPKGLRETIDKYNSDIKSVGYDTVFDRQTLEGCDGAPVAIDTPPYHAVKCKGSTSSFKGGIKINTRCQVLNQYDEVIAGLYAAGEATGGLWSAHGTYLPCTMVTAAMTFGRIAGKNAAAESSRK